MEIKPPVAIAVIVIILLIVGFLVYKGTSGGNYGAPPPITSGLPGGNGPTPGGPAPKLPGSPGR